MSDLKGLRFLPSFLRIMFVWFSFALNVSFGLRKDWTLVYGYEEARGGLWLLADRRRRAGFLNSHLWSVASGTGFLSDSEKLLSLESTKLTWKGVPSAQVATQNACDLRVSAVCRESSCLNYYLHSQITRANSFSRPCVFGGPFLCPDPRRGWNWKWSLCEKWILDTA